MKEIDRSTVEARYPAEQEEISHKSSMMDAILDVVSTSFLSS